MKILVSDTEQSHANACKAIIEAECPTATVTTRIETLATSVNYALFTNIDIISRSTTGLSDSRNENEGDTAWEGGVDVPSGWTGFSSAFSSAFGMGECGDSVGIVHALGSDSHVRDTDPSRLDIISACSAGDGSGNCDASYGTGLEFFHDEETTQSYATARIAGIIGQMMIDHPTWNFHDCRMALRQTASLYATAWVEDGGYGYVDKTAANAVTDLGISSPTRKSYTNSDSSLVLEWVENPQSIFSSTVIAVYDTEPSRTDEPDTANIIYNGTDETYTYSHSFNSNKWIVYYSKNSDGSYSLIENNSDTSYWFDKIEIALSKALVKNWGSEVKTAIYSKFTQVPHTDFYNAMIGGMFYKENSDDPATYPYCVYWFMGDKPMYYFGETNPEEGEDILCQISIFYKDNKQQYDPTNIDIYETNLRNVYDWASLSLTNYTLMEMRRESSVTTKIDDVWHCAGTYRIKIDKN